MRKLLTILTLAPMIASAAVEDKEIALCASKSGTVDRLACFDQLADKHGLAPKTVATTSTGKGKWQTSTKTDPLTDKSVHLALLDADTGVGRFGEVVDMVVRCKDNTTELYINWNSYLGMDSTSVTHRIDKAQAVRSTWDVSTDHKSSFMRAPIGALKQMAEGESFVASITPYGESPVTAVFDIKGAGAALQDIRKGCSW